MKDTYTVENIFIETDNIIHEESSISVEVVPINEIFMVLKNEDNERIIIVDKIIIN